MGTFTILTGARVPLKQGGNVAAYFCTPDLEVVHAVAGPVAPDVFLREARWAADLFSRFPEKDAEELRSCVAQAHEAASEEFTLVSWNVPRGVENPNGSLVTSKLAAAPLPPLEAVARYFFEEVLGETLSDADIRYESGARRRNRLSPAQKGEAPQRGGGSEEGRRAR